MIYKHPRIVVKVDHPNQSVKFSVEGLNSKGEIETIAGYIIDAPKVLTNNTFEIPLHNLLIGKEE